MKIITAAYILGSVQRCFHKSSFKSSRVQLHIDEIHTRRKVILLHSINYDKISLSSQNKTMLLRRDLQHTLYFLIYFERFHVDVDPRFEDSLLMLHIGAFDTAMMTSTVPTVFAWAFAS